LSSLPPALPVRAVSPRRGPADVTRITCHRKGLASGLQVNNAANARGKHPRAIPAHALPRPPHPPLRTLIRAPTPRTTPSKQRPPDGTPTQNRAMPALTPVGSAVGPARLVSKAREPT